MRAATRIALFAITAVLAGGCGRTPEERPTDTGSREVVKAFFGAIGQRDWGAAYDALDPESRRKCSREEFARRGEVYRKQLGFELTGVQVPICEERGDEATAHVMLTGRGHSRREYKDAITLRRQDGKWWVVLPTRFGHS